MAFFFGDSFDLYATLSDMIPTYWDSISGSFALVAGRFGGQSLSPQNAAHLNKSSGSNDQVHHLNFSYFDSNTHSGTSIYGFIELMDGSTPQCTVCFRSDGSMVLTSGAQTGTVLATYSGAVSGVSTWYGFEVEVVISNTAGSIAVRRNGNVVNDFFASGLNTRSTSNNYANAISLGCGGNFSGFTFDDFVWRSDASSVPWVGDIRSYTRHPASDQSVTWSASGAAGLSQNYGQIGAVSVSNTQARLKYITMLYPGQITSISFGSYSGMSGNVKAAIWATDVTGNPTTVLFASASQAVVGGGAGTNTFTVTGVTVAAGQKIWIGVTSDTLAGNWVVNQSASTPQGAVIAASFSSFPQASPVITTPAQDPSCAISYTILGNWGNVADQQQDGATTFVFSSTVGQSDFYGLSAITGTPASVVGVVTRAFAEKSDAGTRNISLNLKSGATTSNGPSVALNTTFAWFYRTDLVDPATSAAWTATAVNNLQIGQTVTA